MIASVDNPKVRQARALLDRRGRERSGRCLLEGVRLIEDAIRAGVNPALVFYVASAQEALRAQALLAAIKAAGIPVWEVTEPIFGALSDTATSQGLIAVVPIPRFERPDAAGVTLVVDQVRDPGNLGTILRSAEAAGAGPVLMARGCVDPWSAKVLRAGMGAHFRLALAADLSWPEVARRVSGRTLWLADAAGETAYDRVDWTQPCALVIGGETTGLSRGAFSLGGSRVAIPMAGEADSLNVAMAATVLLFEAARQRRQALSRNA